MPRLRQSRRLTPSQKRKLKIAAAVGGGALAAIPIGRSAYRIGYKMRYVPNNVLAHSQRAVLGGGTKFTRFGKNFTNRGLDQIEDIIALNANKLADRTVTAAYGAAGKKMQELHKKYPLVPMLNKAGYKLDLVWRRMWDASPRLAEKLNKDRQKAQMVANKWKKIYQGWQDQYEWIVTGMHPPSTGRKVPTARSIAKKRSGDAVKPVQHWLPAHKITSEVSEAKVMAGDAATWNKKHLPQLTRILTGQYLKKNPSRYYTYKGERLRTPPKKVIERRLIGIRNEAIGDPQTLRQVDKYLSAITRRGKSLPTGDARNWPVVNRKRPNYKRKRR